MCVSVCICVCVYGQGYKQNTSGIYDRSDGVDLCVLPGDSAGTIVGSRQPMKVYCTSSDEMYWVKSQYVQLIGNTFYER